MRVILLFFPLLLCCCSGENLYVPANCENILYTGRVFVSEEGKACFDYPGISIQANFTGKSIGIKMKPNSGYFIVSIDDKQPFKLKTIGRDSIFCLADDLIDSIHSIKIVHISEGLFSQPEFYGFILNSGACLLEKPERRKCKIEFIGNSITCGYGVESLNGEESFNDSTSNFCLSYAALTSRAV